MKEKVKAFFVSNWTISEKSLLLADVLLLGVLIGWLTSPLKHGFSFFSNNSCENNSCGNNNSSGMKKDKKKVKDEEEE